MRQKLLGAEHPDVATSLNNLAGVLFRQGKYEAAESLYRQGLQMSQKDVYKRQAPAWLSLCLI